MTSCPNNNKIFDNFLFESGLINKKLSDSDKAYQRRRVYYTICVLIRLAIAGLLLQLKDNKYLPYILAVISFAVIIKMSYREQDNQWWSNSFQMIIAVALFISSILIIKKKIPTYIPSLILFISVFGGIFQSLLIPSC